MVSKQYILSNTTVAYFFVTYTVCSSKLRGIWDQPLRSSHRSRAEKTSRQCYYCGSSHFQMMLNEFAWEKQSANKFHIIYAGLWEDRILHLADRGRKRGERPSWSWLSGSGEKEKNLSKNKKVNKHIWTNRGDWWGEGNRELKRERPKFQEGKRRESDGRTGRTRGEEERDAHVFQSMWFCLRSSFFYMSLGSVVLLFPSLASAVTHTRTEYADILREMQASTHTHTHTGYISKRTSAIWLLSGTHARRRKERKKGTQLD